MDEAGFVGITPDVLGTPSGSDLLNSLSSGIGKVADIGFNIQNMILKNQAQSQNFQLETLKQSLGFKTAQTQATTQAQIAQYQAQGQIASAMKAAGISTGGTMSPVMLLLGAGLIYLLAVKK